MLKLLKSNYIISSIILISSILITILFCIKSSIVLNLSSFLGNWLIIFLTIAGMVLCESIFLLSVDSIICRGKKFKERIFYVMKSLWLSQIILLPIILTLFLVNTFINLDVSLINKILAFSIAYLSQLVLFFSYKFVTRYDWSTTIKVVASQSILTILLTLLLKFI